MPIKRTRKETSYKMLTAFDLAQALDRVGYDTEIRFATEDITRLFPWEQPKMHYIMRTRKYGDDNLIIGRLSGGGTMIRSTSDFVTAWEENNPRARVFGLNEFISRYLLDFGNGVQRVAVQAVRTA